ncbi:hypothetical protein CRG98_000798 [Punica granatum]|uniref:Uncharacterized protein n=1 Tax=Punica granatum TaxID=22663 RepID=A0A2I0LDH8_PUNGR|nr:hypothetical protein CRG98_000798 [Punica granatum]
MIEHPYTSRQWTRIKLTKEIELHRKVNTRSGSLHHERKFTGNKDRSLKERQGRARPKLRVSEARRRRRNDSTEKREPTVVDHRSCELSSATEVVNGDLLNPSFSCINGSVLSMFSATIFNASFVGQKLGIDASVMSFTVPLLPTPEDFPEDIILVTMPVLTAHRTLIPWTLLLAGYTRQGVVHETLAMLQDMPALMGI